MPLARALASRPRIAAALDAIPIAAATTMIAVDAFALLVLARAPAFLVFLLPIAGLVVAATPWRSAAAGAAAERRDDG